MYCVYRVLCVVLCAQETHAGTSLVAMVGPALAGTVAHYRMGNIYPRVLPSLLLGSGLGAWAGARIATNLNDKQQRTVYCSLLGCLSLYQIRVGWKRYMTMRV